MQLFGRNTPEAKLISELFDLSLQLAKSGVVVRRHGPTVVGRETIEYKRNGILLATILPYIHDERVLTVTAPLTPELEALIRRHAIVSFLAHGE
jgi:hypothetical protein